MSSLYSSVNICIHPYSHPIVSSFSYYELGCYECSYTYVFLQTHVLIYPGCILEVELLVPGLIQIDISRYSSFPKWLDQFLLPPAVYESSSCSTSLSTLDVVSLLNFIHSGGYMDKFYCGFNSIFPDEYCNNVEHLFTCFTFGYSLQWWAR